LGKSSTANQIIAQDLATFSRENYLFVTADFNANPHTPEREIFANNDRLKDVLSGYSLEEQYTYHEFTGKAWLAIDTIYFDSRCQLEKVKIDRQQWEDVWPSDHFPVIATISIALTLNPSPKGRGTLNFPLALWERGLGGEGCNLVEEINFY